MVDNLYVLLYIQSIKLLVKNKIKNINYNYYYYKREPLTRGFAVLKSGRETTDEQPGNFTDNIHIH